MAAAGDYPIEEYGMTFKSWKAWKFMQLTAVECIDELLDNHLPIGIDNVRRWLEEHVRPGDKVEEDEIAYVVRFAVHMMTSNRKD